MTPAVPGIPTLRHLTRNILRNAAVGLVFLIPGITYTLCISGTAIIVRDADLRAEAFRQRQAAGQISLPLAAGPPAT